MPSSPASDSSRDQSISVHKAPVDNDVPETAPKTESSDPSRAAASEQSDNQATSTDEAHSQVSNDANQQSATFTPPFFKKGHNETKNKERALSIIESLPTVKTPIPGDYSTAASAANNNISANAASAHTPIDEQTTVAELPTAHMPAVSNPAATPATLQPTQTPATPDPAVQATTTLTAVQPDPVTTGEKSADPSHPVQSKTSRRPRLLRRIQRLPLKTRVASYILLAILLFGCLAPLVFAASYGIRAYQTYSELKSHATSGVQHLLAVKDLFTGVHNHPMNVLDPRKLSLARQDLAQARQDFSTVQTLLKQSEFVQAANQYLPAYRTQITSAGAASQIGIDISTIGTQLVDVVTTLAPRLHNPVLSNDKSPLLKQADFDLIGNTIDSILPLLSDMQNQSHNLSLDSLPVSAHQRTQVSQLLQYLPQASQYLLLARSLLGSANWILGVDHPRSFLVQTLDRGELRATGGFTGQFGELNINGGRVAPFSLHNIALIEYAANNPTAGNLAPAAYRSWWPFANWGLRDSNLSADFPTSAKLAIDQYYQETHHQVDGLISFSPFLIEHVLQITGPIHIPQYGETITAQNLEERLHYYQLDNKGIRKEELVEKVYNTPDAPDKARKLFTARLAHVLMDQVSHAPPQELLAIGKQFLTDLKTRDLQVYATDPQVEGLLQQYGFAGRMDVSTNHDGLYIVQMNLSASKASQYVQTTLHDTVTLDSTGGALHNLTMRLAYKELGPVYGLDTYRDYIRFYVPPGAQFRDGDGFDTGTPLCGGVLGLCPATNVYPQNELVCPAGKYDAGAAASMLNDPYVGQYHPLDTVGAPTNMQSDEPGRAMFGGWVVIPNTCTANISLSWYVPAQNTNPYSLLFQRQTSTYPEMHLTIKPAIKACPAHTSLTFNGQINQDTAFTISTGSTRTTENSPPSCNLVVSNP